jgi:hypothetical protein
MGYRVIEDARAKADGKTEGKRKVRNASVHLVGA